MKNTIRLERAKLDISQEELAIAIGVSRQTIHSVEKGRFTPSAVTALKLANFFKTQVENIFSLEASD